MKKLHLFKTVLLLCALMVGSGNAWAADVVTTYTFTDRDWAATCNDEDANWIGDRASGFTSGQGVQIYGSKTFSATSPISFTNVKNIRVTYCTNKKNGHGTISVQVGTGTQQDFSVTKPSSGGTTLKTHDYTFNPFETGSVILTVECEENSMYIYSIAITTEGTPTPSIGANNVSIAYSATGGSIDYEVENETLDGVLTAACTSGGSWLTVGTVTASTVPFTTTVNNGDERSATVRLTYTYDTDKTVTKDVTVTQRSQIETLWVETSLSDLTADDIFVIVGDNGNTYALPNNYGTSTPSVVAVTVESGKLTGNVAATIQWNISGNASDGYTFYPNGDTDTWLYTTNNNDGVRVGTNTDNKFTITNDYLYNTGTSRYVGIYQSQDWRCYTTINTNISGQTFKFYKKIRVTSVAMNGAGYATFASASKLDLTSLPEGLTAYKAKVSGANVTFSPFTQKISANTGVLLKGVENKTYSIVIAETGTDVENNDFKVNTSGSTFDKTDGKLYFALKKSAGDLLFGTFDPSELAIPANKAYLIVDESAFKTPARELSISFEDGETTGVVSVAKPQSTQTAEYFNLNGQRVAQPTKGLYIVNGKKVVIK